METDTKSETTVPRHGMSAEAQRIAVAKSLGLRFEDREYETAWPQSKKYRAGGWYKGDVFVGALPDYLNDLNAMHEAEKMLTSQQQYDYSLMLCRGWMSDRRDSWRGVNATSAQRAEAFLKTLGLWRS